MALLLLADARFSAVSRLISASTLAVVFLAATIAQWLASYPDIQLLIFSYQYSFQLLPAS